jgi:poly [ADP-ribose] polymerase
MAQVDAAETKRVSALFRKTRQAMHACHGYEVSRVLSVEIEHEGPAFATDGEVIGGIRELWHGSQASNILSILRSGLVVPKTAAHGRMFGDGIYFSDQSTKALNYATGWWSGRGSQPEAFMFLAQVAMGKMYRPRGPMGGGALPAGYDSVFAEAGRAGVQNNEMIVARPSQVRVMRLVEFTG